LRGQAPCRIYGRDQATPFENVYAYSRAIRAGNHVFVSGTTARSPDLEGDAYAQTKAALAIIAYRSLFTRS
jgi:enamine deaminase RidA (YjgF/YER057c/UK114 family)